MPGERLYLMPDIQNPHDALALMIRTGDPLTILGYCPKYYARDFNDLLRSVDAERVEVTVERVNLDAPLQYRVLCKLSAPWPAGFSPFCGNEYQPIAEPKVAAEAL